MAIPLKKKAETKVIGFADVLAKTAKAKPSAVKKSTMKQLTPPAKIKQAVDDYVKAKTVSKKCEAQMDRCGNEVREYVIGVQDTDGNMGRFSGSYQVMGNKESTKFVSVNKYSINADDKDEIQSILGDDYGRLIEENYTVKLKPEVFEDENMSAFLMELIGEHFGDFFETVVSLKAKAGFNSSIYHTVDNTEELEVLRTFVKQNKASLR